MNKKVMGVLVAVLAVAVALLIALLGGEFDSLLYPTTAVQETSIEETSESAKEEVVEETTSVEVVEPPLEHYDVVVGKKNGEDVTINSYDYVADISGVKITDLEAFEQELTKLPKLLYIDMCDCGLSNEQMEELMEKFPDVKFVWKLYMGMWNCRTDALAFSTLHAWVDDPRLSNKDAQQFKYCTDLVSFDIGHNDVYDIEFLKNMPNLHILIMVDNFNTDQGGRFKDLSVLKNCPNMMYLEFFVSHVSDLSFLQYNKEMVDLNISYSLVNDSTYLYDLPKIERLYMESTAIPYTEFQNLQKKYPDAYMVYYGSGSVDQGWRTHPRYFAMIDMYRKNYWNDLFRTEEELKDVATYDMLVIDGVRYYGTSTTCEAPTEEEIAGTITSSVGEGAIPTEDGSCNFSGVGREYSKDPGNGYIKVKKLDGNYYWFYKNEVIARLLREKLGN